MSKKKKKRPARSRLYIDPVAVRAALYRKRMSMERFQKLSGFAPELCETLYYGGKVPLAVVEQLADFFKCPANDLLMPAGRTTQAEKEYFYGSRAPSIAKELEIMFGGDYDPYKSEPSPADELPARRVKQPRRVYRAGGFSGA